jgi:SdrD B-like domain
MKLRHLVVAVYFLVAASASGQSLKLQYNETATLAVAGATAAYGLNSSIAEASAIDGLVRVHGVGPGSTQVIVVAGETTLSLSVTVQEPPIVYPVGFLAPGVSRKGESGIYESRFSSNPRQVLNSFTFRRDDSGSVKQFRLTLANYFDSAVQSRFGIPQISFDLESPKLRIGIGDQTVVTSFLTVGGTQLRGLHFRSEDWSAHIAAASLASFGGTFFATNPEYVAGVTRRFRLNSSDTIAGNVYYFKNPAEDLAVAKNGPVASALYTREVGEVFRLDSEIAAGRSSIGFTTSSKYETKLRHFSAEVRYRPFSLPSLALDAQRGTSANLDYGASISSRLNVASTFVGSSFDLPLVKQRSFTTSGRALFTIIPDLTLYGGSAFSSFDATSTTAVKTRTLAIPSGATYRWLNANAGVEFAPTFDLENKRRADAYNLDAGFTSGRVRIYGYFRHQVDLPTLDTFLTEIPGLQDALQRAGIYISDVGRLIEFLRDTAFLVNLGFASSVSFNVAPSRDERGAALEWSSARQRATVNVFDVETQLVSSVMRMRSGSLMYALSLGHADELNAAASITQTQTGSSSTRWPIFGIAYRHRFSGVPEVGIRRRGRIAGHVFRDENRAGRYVEGAAGIAGATVLLDAEISTKTDASGFFTFEGVRSGVHQVSVSLPIDIPISFTTDSPQRVDINERADFGVTFLLAKIYGRVVNDAGAGVQNAMLKLEGPSLSRTVLSESTGDYSFENVADGAYWLSTVPDSLPAGYDLSLITENPLVVRNSAPVRLDILAKALRSVSGTVARLDPLTGGSLPAEGIRVSIPEISRVAQTNAAGRYRFTDLPAGTFTVEVVTATNRYTQRVTLSAAPMTLANTNFTVVGR